MRIAVIGANGQLGSDLCACFAAGGDEVAALDHDAIRVEEIDSVRRALGEAGPDAILNTAAFHNVPRCEEDPATTFAVNAQGALNVARVASEIGAVNVYYSTDYVFDGAKGAPYLESDAPGPLNVYAASKLAGEHLTSAYSERSYVIRVSGIYGAVPCRAKGENFIVKMARLARQKPEVRVVADEVLTPTPTREIARHTAPILASEAYGVYHLTCEGACSWYEFCREIFDLLEIETPLHRASVTDFPSGVRRPFYSVLENARYNALGGEPMPDWRTALRQFLDRDFGQRGSRKPTQG